VAALRRQLSPTPRSRRVKNITEFGLFVACRRHRRHGHLSISIGEVGESDQLQEGDQSSPLLDVDVEKERISLASSTGADPFEKAPRRSSAVTS